MADRYISGFGLCLGVFTWLFLDDIGVQGCGGSRFDDLLQFAFSDFQSKFSMSKIIRIFLNLFFIKECHLRSTFIINGNF